MNPTIYEHQKNMEQNACYVLITCKPPKEDGRMDVELIYEGDAALAAYLIESAQGFIEES